MKAKDLHIGDWVLFADVPCKVIGVTINGATIDLSNFDNSKGKQACIDLCDISPIPLIEEFLIKNGYVIISEDGSYQRYRDDLIIRKVKESEFAVYLPVGNFEEEKTVLIDIIQYVNELQHLLWILEYKNEFSLTNKV